MILTKDSGKGCLKSGSGLFVGALRERDVFETAGVELPWMVVYLFQ